MSERFGYYINLHERGDFYADVRNQVGESIFELRADEEGSVSLIEAGYMKDYKDIDGLSEYLKSVDVIGKDSTLMMSGAFEAHNAAQAAGEDPLSLLEANIASVIRNQGEISLGGGTFKSDELQEVLELLRNRENDEQSTASEFSASELERVETFAANLKKAVFDRDEVSIAGGVFVPGELIIFSEFLKQQIQMANNNEAAEQASPKG